MNHQPGMSIERFEEEYEGQPVWDVGKPQQYFVDTLSENLPEAPVLDIGCGKGSLSKLVADLGCEVLGIDFSPKAIESARKKFFGSTPNLSFKVHDAFKLEELNSEFGSILDCCFFHMLDDKARGKYISVLNNILKPGGRLYMLNFGVELTVPGAPRGVTEDDIKENFQGDWYIVNSGVTNIEVNGFPEGVPGTYACIEKTPSLVI
ncbi:class I SAM-dependent methyltransferase [Agarilytica rhodophyticola]|uniref:class I SAM-dependent methyltransferase n=1 Tax=Agarilytica rhodophyticola TaxID=1737490 RepID=UPI000B347F56|nr:class I SAM-dependent methyltransferase [Agarilytica rhodophyticola]